MAAPAAFFDRGTTANVAAFDAILASAHIDGDRLVMERRGTADVQADGDRFRAMVRALHDQDKSLADAAASHKAALDQARADWTDSERRVADLQNQIQVGQKRQADFEMARRREKALSDRSAALEQVWSDAAAATRAARRSGCLGVRAGGAKGFDRGRQPGTRVDRNPAADRFSDRRGQGFAE